MPQDITIEREKGKGVIGIIGRDSDFRRTWSSQSGAGGRVPVTVIENHELKSDEFSWNRTVTVHLFCGQSFLFENMSRIPVAAVAAALFLDGCMV